MLSKLKQQAAVAITKQNEHPDYNLKSFLGTIMLFTIFALML